MVPTPHCFSAEDASRIIEMAWEDRTPVEAITMRLGLNESGVVAFMRQQLKQRSFCMWRKRMAGRVTKHLSLRSPDVARAHCPTRYECQY
jgi:uncharacterized protein (TIGR03643 family)